MKKKDLLTQVVSVKKALINAVKELLTAVIVSPERAASFSDALAEFSTAREQLVTARYKFIEEASRGHSFLEESDHIKFSQGDGLLDLEEKFKLAADKIEPFVELGNNKEWRKIIASELERLFSYSEKIAYMYTAPPKYYDILYHFMIEGSSGGLTELDNYCERKFRDIITRFYSNECAPEIQARIEFICDILKDIDNYLENGFEESIFLKALNIDDEASLLFPKTRPLSCAWESIKSWWRGSNTEAQAQPASQHSEDALNDEGTMTAELSSVASEPVLTRSVEIDMNSGEEYSAPVEQNDLRRSPTFTV